MKHYLAAILTAGLVACAGEPSSQQVCSTMIEGDSETAMDIRQDGIEPAELCACIGATIDAMDVKEKATHLAVMNAVTAIRENQGGGVEAAAEFLEEQLRASEGGYAFDEDAFQNTGRLLNKVGDQLEDDGSCAAG